MADEQLEKNCKKYFEKIDEVMSPISGVGPESKRSQEEHKKVEYLELLQNEDNKKLIEQYLNKMGVKENSNKNYTFSSTKERVYQKILDQQSKSIEDIDRGNHSPKKIVGSPTKNYNKYFSTTKEKNGLHGKISLTNMTEDGNDTDRRADLKSLVQKKKIELKKPSLPNFNTNLTPRSNKSFNKDGSKFRNVNLNGEVDQDAEKKMKHTIVQLKRTIESQKNELLKLDKTKKENLRYISKLEAVLNDEISKKSGNKQSLNISNGSINKFASRKGFEPVEIDVSKLKELFNDSKAFVKCVGNMLIEIESTIENMQTSNSTNLNKTSTGLYKKNTISDISSFEGGNRQSIIKNDRLDKILSAIRTNYIEFNTKLENKYSGINNLPDTEGQNTTEISASVGRNSVTQRLKSKISTEFGSHNRVTLSEKKRFTTKTELDKKLSIKRNARNSIAVTNNSFKNNLNINKSLNIENGTPLIKRLNSNVSPKAFKNELRLSNTNINFKQSDDLDKDKNDSKIEGSSEQDKKLGTISKRLEKRLNTITNNSSLQNRETKRQTTITQGTMESKKMSSIIKNISSKRMSNQAIGSNESLSKKLEA